MRFTPLTEEQAAAQSSGVWEDGIYDYEVSEATEEVSQNSGNEMFHLKVWIFNQTGGRKLLHSYLVQSEKARWKIREFCKSCGLMDAYNAGSLMEGEIVGRTGICEVATEESNGYPPKNVIRQWMQKADKRQTSMPIASKRTKSPAGDIDDEIPF